MKILMNVEKEAINETLNKIRAFKDNFLEWAIKEESPAKYSKDLLWHLRLINEIDEHFINLIHLIEEETEHDRQNQTDKN